MKCVIAIQWTLFVNWQKEISECSSIDKRQSCYIQWKKFITKPTVWFHLYMISRICNYIERIDQWLTKEELDLSGRLSGVKGHEAFFELVKMFYIHIVVTVVQFCKYANKNWNLDFKWMMFN